MDFQIWDARIHPRLQGCYTERKSWTKYTFAEHIYRVEYRFDVVEDIM
jgi:hypothetical protein